MTEGSIPDKSATFIRQKKRGEEGRYQRSATGVDQRKHSQRGGDKEKGFQSENYFDPGGGGGGGGGVGGLFVGFGCVGFWGCGLCWGVGLGWWGVWGGVCGVCCLGVAFWCFDTTCPSSLPPSHPHRCITLPPFSSHCVRVEKMLP